MAEHNGHAPASGAASAAAVSQQPRPALSSQALREIATWQVGSIGPGMAVRDGGMFKKAQVRLPPDGYQSV